MLHAALSTTYEDVADLLDSLAKAHQRKYGGYLEDLRADANSLFVEAFDAFEEEKGDFFNWVKYFVWVRLLYNRRKQLRESKRYSSLQDVSRNDPAYFDLEDFISGLSQDASKVVKLALDPPKSVLQGAGQQGGVPLQGACTNKGRNKGGVYTKASKNKGRPRTIGMALRRYLYDLGWTVRRVTCTFNEIKESL